MHFSDLGSRSVAVFRSRIAFSCSFQISDRVHFAVRKKPINTTMNIFDRIAMLFRSNVNAVISEFEQPEKMLNQIILDMRSQLVRAKQQVAAAIADEKRLQDQTKQELKEAEDWERRAMLAVQQNQDELAKQALMRRTEHISRGE